MSLRNISICNRWGRNNPLTVTDRDKGRTGPSHPGRVRISGHTRVDNLPLWTRSHAKSGGLSTLDFKREKIHARICHGSPDLDLYIGANRLLSKFDSEGVLYYTKVLPREMSPQYPKPPSFISKLNKTAGHGYIDTPGTVYLEVFVDSPQGCIVLSFSFAGAAVQKTKGPADT